MTLHKLTITSFGLALATVATLATAQTAAPAAEPAKEAAPAAAPATATTGDAMTGLAAWYGRKFTGRRTASGQRFNPYAMTAAHPTLAFGTRVKVTNTKNNRSATVVINDRGPTSPGRIVDVSLAAAKKLHFVRAGLTPVSLEVVGQAPLKRHRKH